MVDLQTAIEELNTGKIEFDYKSDDCCTTEGEVVILLKRLVDIEEENNRQKAEIERLQKAIKVQDIMIEQQDYVLKTAKSEAIKEFAEKLKEISSHIVDKNLNVINFVEVDDIDDLVKEMVGE